MKNITLLLVILLAQFSISQTISTDAPSVSAGATTVGESIFQVESRIQYSVSGFIKTFQIPSNLFRVGIGNKFELRITNGITRVLNSTRIDRLAVGFKTQLLNKPEGNTQIAFLMNAAIPNFKTDDYSGAASFAFNHNLGAKNSIGYNAGFGYTTIGNSGNSVESHSIFGSFIYSHAFTDKFSVFGELYGNYWHITTLNIDDSSLDFDCGFLYLINDRFQIDYSYGLGISNDSSFHAIGFNFMIGTKAK